MNNSIISILIPVYNVERYLPRCIESVLVQDFHYWEMILVDDGSPDKCPQICDEYAEKDNRIRVVHKPNGGLVSARLAGYEASQGSYLMFLDSDDYLLPNALSVLYNKIEEGYDIVKGNDIRFNGDWNKLEKPRLVGKEILGNKNYLTSMLSYDVLPYLWGGLYKKDLFCSHVFSDKQDITIGEDWITNISIWNKVNKYIAVDSPVYAYFINDDSMMQQNVISFEYQEKMRDKIMKYIPTGDHELCAQVELSFLASAIKGFFVPELKWNNKIYEEIIQCLKDKTKNNEIKQKIDNKFLLFIKNRYLFFIYTSLYKYLFRKFRLKGYKRRII